MIREDYIQGEGEGALQLSAEEEAAKARRERLKAVVEYIRGESRAVRLVDPAVFAAEPFSYSEEELTQLWEDLAAEEEFKDIVRTQDERSGVEYLHSEVLLTVPYAKLMLRTQSGDPLYLIAETTREQSQIYPQPVAATFFEYAPFNLKVEDVLTHIQQLQLDPQYEDIKTVEASNGAIYTYSDRYMTRKRAFQIAEWCEVEQYTKP